MRLRQWMQEMNLYGRRPEMRTTWVLGLLLIVALGVNFFYLPSGIAWLTAVVYIGMAGVSFWSNLQLAKKNLFEQLEKQQLQGIIVSLQDGVIAYNPNFKIEVFNEAAERIFDIKAEDLVGEMFEPKQAGDWRWQRLTQVMFPSLAPAVVPRSSAGEWPQVVDISFQDPVMELRVTTAKILDRAGRVLGFMKIVRDRTREVGAAKAKSQFVTIAAHQLRTPLNALSWTLETLAHEEGLSEEGRQIIQNGRLAAAKLIKTVNDLLDVSKIEEGQFGYQMKDLELSRFLEEILAQKTATAESYGIKIYLDRGGLEGLKVRVDAKKLALAVENFIDNAIKYNVQNGEVTVKMEMIDGKPFVKVSIIDTGIGIPPHQIEQLFTKFFRGENVVKFQTEGTGLGLYIAKNIIRQHGGQVGAESTLNRGSTFYFTLPTDPRLVPTREVFAG